MNLKDLLLKSNVNEVSDLLCKAFTDKDIKNFAEEEVGESGSITGATQELLRERAHTPEQIGGAEISGPYLDSPDDMPLSLEEIAHYLELGETPPEPPPSGFHGEYDSDDGTETLEGFRIIDPNDTMRGNAFGQGTPRWRNQYAPEEGISDGLVESSDGRLPKYGRLARDMRREVPKYPIPVDQLKEMLKFIGASDFRGEDIRKKIRGAMLPEDARKEMAAQEMEELESILGKPPYRPSSSNSDPETSAYRRASQDLMSQIMSGSLRPTGGNQERADTGTTSGPSLEDILREVEEAKGRGHHPGSTNGDEFIDKLAFRRAGNNGDLYTAYRELQGMAPHIIADYNRRVRGSFGDLRNDVSQGENPGFTSMPTYDYDGDYDGPIGGDAAVPGYNQRRGIIVRGSGPGGQSGPPPPGRSPQPPQRGLFPNPKGPILDGEHTRMDLTSLAGDGVDNSLITRILRAITGKLR